jgi:CBS-domain-containing membrane protein
MKREPTQEERETEEAEQVMEKSQIRRLSVLNREKLLVGIVSLEILQPKTMKTVPEGRWKESPNLLDGH